MRRSILPLVSVVILAPEQRMFGIDTHTPVDGLPGLLRVA
jgi:hypothetical protein